ncbi:MAG TPA: DUF2950 domain-containing protein [Thermoanaerobaculia bacterium]|nr:DUF2950 domain-containing protein [Thermoanaerobaculia bacterium]
MINKKAFRFLPAPAALAFLAAAVASAAAFKSPEDAMKAVGELAAAPDDKKAEQVFGAGCADLLYSGDDVADREEASRVRQAVLEGIAFEDHGADRKIALLGQSRWPFPIALVRTDGSWQFDVEAGREEIVNRRVGRNELLTLKTIHAYVDAQREYFAGKNSGATPAYAQKIVSSEGKHDGLYWSAASAGHQSPLGPLVAGAAAEGYRGVPAESPFHGYYFRVVTSQGKNAPGGVESYVDEKGAMTKGFALVAWPAKYGSSGVMTFQVDRQGIVFQKDLGSDTATAAAAIQAYDPDETWNPTKD